MSVRFRIRGETRIQDGPAGSILADLAFAAGIPLNTACGARGACGRCAVILHEGTFTIRGSEVRVEAESPRRALACGTRTVSADAVVEIPDKSLVEQRASIAEDFVLPPFDWTPVQKRTTVSVSGGDWETASSDAERLALALAGAGGPAGAVPDLHVARELPERLAAAPRLDVSWGPFGGGVDVTAVASAGTTRHLGLAVDLGTTTVVALLADLESGTVVGRASAYNAQMRRGDDVAARISSSMAPGGHRG